ncbi:TetR/AcrR family transcriptional regulator [Paenibacillus kobensis]|uniref:TetR/AcrR family transcriptional regulator n=1 Tax=Paenibacillus kobensis TaxID=59841 RepID=UPI0013E39FD4|nr:TetR/AcrR family transcriptional regulator [Paenibacillus kobensis]
MYEAFEKLPEEKKASILSSCLEEFSEHGYDQASTDAITSRAGISKGILFHYFKSKKNVYLYLLRHVSDMLTGKVLASIGDAPKDDFFERIKALAATKLVIGFQYERESKFLIHAFARPAKSVQQEVQQFYKANIEAHERAGTMVRVYDVHLLHPSKLRDGVTPERVVQMVTLFMESFTNQVLASYRTGDEEVMERTVYWTNELTAYLDLMKHGAYRSEENENK